MNFIVHIKELAINWNAISSIATLLMAIATFATILYSKKQIKEIRRQWYEANRARLAFNVVTYKSVILLKIENIGKESIRDLTLNINEEFLNKMVIRELVSSLQKICNKRMCLSPGRSMYYILSSKYEVQHSTIEGHSYSREEINRHLDSIINEPLIITGLYNGEKISEKIIISQYLGSVVVDNNEVIKLDNIYQELKKMNNILRRKGF